MYLRGKRWSTTQVVIILVRLAMGTRGDPLEEAATDNCGMATAALPCRGQGMSDLPGIAVVVVVDVGTDEVVDEVDVVDVDDGTVVEEVEETVVEVVESRGATARAGLLSSENPASPVPRATQSRGQPRQPAREGGLIPSF